MSGPLLWDISRAFLRELFTTVKMRSLSLRCRTRFSPSSIFRRFSERISVPQISPFFMRVDITTSWSSCLRWIFFHRGSALLRVFEAFCHLLAFCLPMRSLTRCFHFLSHMLVQTVRNSSSSVGFSLKSFSSFSTSSHWLASFPMRFQWYLRKLVKSWVATCRTLRSEPVVSMVGSASWSFSPNIISRKFILVPALKPSPLLFRVRGLY
jgi:hypothetical protein